MAEANDDGEGDSSYLVVVWAGLCLLAMSPVGAIFGFVVGVAVAFFVAPVMFLVLGPLGIDVATLPPVQLIVGVPYGAMVLFFLVRAAIRLMQGDSYGARGWASWAVTWTGFALVFVLSAQSLKDSWH